MYDFAESQQTLALQSRSEAVDFIFLYYDANGDGYLNENEWTTICTIADTEISKEDISKTFNYLDSDGDKLISWSELYANIDKLENIVEPLLH